MKQFFLFTMLLLSLVTQAQENGSIAGTLTDKESADGQPLPFASVIIKGTTQGSTSGFDGNYIISNVAPGTYTLVISFVGYETLEVPNVVVASDKTITINTGLGASAAALDEVIITGTGSRKESVQALLIDQQKAVVQKQSIGAKELASKGVSDAAAAVTKISGISKQEGGGNVYVRGLGDRYQNTTYNGLPLPSNDINKKNIDLSLFSSDLIQNIGVSKTYAANFYGDFAAGNVNIASKEYSGDFFIESDLGTGINTNAQGENFVRSEGTSFFGYYNRYNNNPFATILQNGFDPVDGGTPINISGKITGGNSWDIGEESRLSVFATAAFSNNFEYREGQAGSFTTVEAVNFPNAEEYVYNTNTTALLNLTYRINGDHKIKFNSVFINDATDEVGYFGTEGQGRNRDAILDTDEGFYVSNVQFDQDMIFVNQLLGTHTLDENLKLDWAIGANTVLARQPDRRRISVEGFDRTFDNDPSTNPIFFNNIPFDNQRYFQDIEDKEINARLNLEYTLNENTVFNIGYNGRVKERNFENIRYGFDFIEPNTPVPDVNNLDAIFTQENLGVVYDTFVFNSLNDNASGIGNRNVPGDPENTYTGNLDIHAGYVDATLKLGEKWTFAPGIRIESYSQDITYDVINLLSTDPGFANASETFILPSLNIKYALKENQNLRFSASRTVSNPEFKEVAPFVYEDVTNQTGGNPNILGDTPFSDIYNIDLKYEWFFGNSEIFSFAAFAKQINDPVNLVVANDATGTQRYVRSGDQAEVFGAELELRKAILRNEDEDAILSFGLNVTYTFTEQDLKNSEGFINTTFDRNTDELQGASPFLINADVSYSPTFAKYENYTPVANLVFSYFSDRIDALGSGQLGNIIETGIPTLDLVWKNSFGEHYEINASAKNLLNPTIEFFREGTSLGDVPVSAANGSSSIAQYKRGVHLSLQFKYKF
ncbi:TonB-dependent receptor [Dokdonia sp.]|uniref:TonB-dependent receptor n=1 Tax=Dokdonia sp. TaxID=2024995 RepID=UPI0032653226